MILSDQDIQQIKNQLKELVRADQEMRNKYFDAKKDGKEDLYYFDPSLDIRNTETLKGILKRIGGWPTISLLGEEASHDAWLLVQHADHDPEFQKYCLELMTRHSKNVAKKDIAFLTDRLAVKKNQPQEYGTQFSNGKDGKLIMGNVRDPENLDRRRASVGLEPFAHYLEKANKKYSSNK